MLLLSYAASVAASNLLLAGQSAGAVHSAAGKLVGGLLTKSLDAHRTAGRLLVEVVNAINSLNIAGLNIAAGVTNTALSGLIGKIRWVPIAYHAQAWKWTNLLLLLLPHAVA